jgi:hypothetical protein
MGWCPKVSTPLSAGVATFDGDVYLSRGVLTDSDGSSQSDGGGGGRPTRTGLPDSMHLAGGGMPCRVNT